MKKVLITGIDGFVGRHIAYELSKNEDVTGVSLNKKNLTGLPVVYHCADISNERSLAVLDSCHYDAVVHCAASISMDNFNHNLIDANVRGFLNVLRLAKRTGCCHFVYLSSVQVIGIPFELPITENHQVYPRTFYHLTKYIGETYLDQESIPSTTLRISSPVGAGMPSNRFLPFIVNRCLNDEPLTLLGKGRRIQNYIDVSDIAQAVAQVLETGKTGLYNLVSAQSFSNLEVAEMCIKTLKSSSKITFTGEDPEEFSKWIFTTEKAREAFGFTPMKSLKQIIREISGSMSIS